MYVNIYPRASQMVSTQIILVWQYFCLNTSVFKTRTSLELCSLIPQWIRWKWSSSIANLLPHTIQCLEAAAPFPLQLTKRQPEVTERFAINRANSWCCAEYTKAVLGELTVWSGEETHTHTQVTVLCCLVKSLDTCAGSYSISYGGQKKIQHFMESYKGTEVSSKVRCQIRERCRVRLGCHIYLA